MVFHISIILYFRVPDSDEFALNVLLTTAYIHDDPLRVLCDMRQFTFTNVELRKFYETNVSCRQRRRHRHVSCTTNVTIITGRLTQGLPHLHLSPIIDKCVCLVHRFDVYICHPQMFSNQQDATLQ